MELIWKFATPTTLEKIQEVEKEQGIKLPSTLVKTILIGNNGKPSIMEFLSVNGTEHVLNTLLSYNRDDIETVYKAFVHLQGTDLYPVANDPFGNLICLKGDEVVFWNHETNEITQVAKSFEDFLKSLH